MRSLIAWLTGWVAACGGVQAEDPEPPARNASECGGVGSDELHLRSELPSSDPTPLGPAACAALAGIAHAPIESMFISEAVRFVAHVGEPLAATNVVLHHRFTGDIKYSEVTMEPTGPCTYEVTLTPPSHARALHYYVIARDGQSHALAFHGRPSSPYIGEVVGRRHR